MDHITSAPNAGLASRYGTDMVEIFVGLQAERYLIHKKPLCDTAPYFDTMFNGPFKETDSQKCSEPEADPVGFNLFTYVVYAGQFPKNIRNGKHDGEAVVKFYILGNKYLVDEDIMDMALEVMRKMRHRADLKPKISQRAAQAALMSLDTSDSMFIRAMKIVCRDYIKDIVDDQWLAQVLDGVPAKAAVQLMRTLKDDIHRTTLAQPPRGTKREATASDPESEARWSSEDDLY